jgi:hypothetical protein
VKWFSSKQIEDITSLLRGWRDMLPPGVENGVQRECFSGTTTMTQVRAAENGLISLMGPTYYKSCDQIPLGSLVDFSAEQKLSVCILVMLTLLFHSILGCALLTCMSIFF